MNTGSTKWNIVIPVGVNNLTITYDAGYDTIPDDVELAAKMIIGMHTSNRPTGMKSERMGNYGYTRETAIGKKSGFPIDAEKMLAPYRRSYIDFAGQPITPRELTRFSKS